MSRNLKTLAVIFSVALNIVFVSSYVYHKSGLFSLKNRGPNRNRPLYEELNLSREQLEKFVPLRDNFHAFIDEQGRRIKAKQLELIGLLAMEHSYRLAIEAKQEEIQALQREMQERVIDHLLAEKRLFTPRQREKFFALIKERIEKSSGPRPRWMPKKKRRPSKGKRL